ncbi:MAG: CRISPR-associated endonuclease Cas2 [Gammaproteobacteria bacterium]
MSRWWVVSYDIADDARRRRIAEILEGYGQRVQWSVFECCLEDGVFEGLRARLREELDGAVDSLRCYPLCRWCRERVLWQGRGAAATDWNYTIV